MSLDYYRSTGIPEPSLPSCPVVQTLKGQVALVTGASSGIGKAIAIALGHAGASVALNYVAREEEAAAVAEEVGHCGARVHTYKTDVGQEEQVVAMFDRIRRDFGTVDIVVNNAGLQKDAPFHEMSVAQWDLVLGVNLRGQFLCAREGVREFLRRGVRPQVSVAAGKILCISSVHDIIPWAGHVNYAASKGGVMMMMKSIAQEVAEPNARCGTGRRGEGPFPHRGVAVHDPPKTVG